MELLSEYGLFLAKIVTFVIAFGAIVAIIVAAAANRMKPADKGSIEVTKINDTFDDYNEILKSVVLDETVLKEQYKLEKQQLKDKKKEDKKAAKQRKKNKDEEPSENTTETKKRVFVLDFDGDIKASAGEFLREEITAVLSIAQPCDEVIIKLESGGGMVHSYGLAASQMARLTDKKIPLTVCIDKVAASGGYMMACVANKIVAAPFAIVGSIGVIAQLPNFHRLLKKHDVDFEMFTAGEYKRTVTMFGENTKKGREKFTDDLELTHVLFKEFISEHRPSVDIDKVATGETWYGTRALGVNLIDEVKTSDAYILAQHPEADIFSVVFTHKKTMAEKMGFSIEAAIDRLLLKWVGRLQFKRWF